MDAPKNSNNSLETVCKDPAGLYRQIYEWLVRGNSDSAIIDALADHLDKEQAKQIIGAVYDDFFQLMKADPSGLHGWSLAAAQDVYRKMYAIGDFAGCLKALKEIRAIGEKMDGSKPEPRPQLNEAADNIDELPSLDLSQC